ncbi:protein kinase domain-containing protein [Candidatus Uabimicrobium amorphum]|uniref:Protein kinase domain-containing protein n=1 Tax=Uabimicrobium amorphum TaxID=2596890 RepID=A0A5S9F4Y0_UABAM|nr:serine/threonine-protein kinase [Candidatus Uabimicrobium amorphum]BBM85711.1 hypothetical protein UABAM_04086 [Candidatus Uabimicrobium amorphum]
MNAIQRWSKSGLPMVIKNSQLSPITKNKELETHHGEQGTAYGIVQKSTGKEWVIKKFNQGCLPPKNYLKNIRKVVPDDPAFISAKKRLILVPDDLRNKPKNYHSFQMARWLENSILMQKAPGKSWKDLSGEIRDGKCKIKKNKRLSIAHNLVNAVNTLEENNCAHRDLSHENIYIDLDDNGVYFVDWDTMYHTSLPYVKNTSCGTSGYRAPWITESAKKDWQHHSDRFALGILLAEILLMKIDERPTKQGVMFTDEILQKEQDPFVAQKVQKMYEYSENMGDLFLQCLTAKSFAECPVPQQWSDALSEIAPQKNAAKKPLKSTKKDSTKTDATKTDSAEDFIEIAPPAPQGILATSMTSIEKVHKVAQESWDRWRQPVLLSMLALLVLILLLPWMLNSDKSDNDTKNSSYIAENSTTQNDTQQDNTQDTSENTQTDTPNTNAQNNNEQVNTNSQQNTQQNPEIVTINNDNAQNNNVDENSKNPTSNDANTNEKTNNDNKQQDKNVKPVQDFGLQEVTNAKEYHLKIFYADNDLKVIIDNQLVKVDKKNKASIYLTPGAHPVKIYFSAVKFLENGKQKVIGKTSFTKKIRFADQQNINIRINRLKKVWKVVK